MIDLRALRENPAAARASQRARGADESLVDAIIAADERRRASLQAHEDRRAEQKSVSRSIGKASPEERESILAQARELADDVKRLAAEAEAAEAELDQLVMKLDNIIEEGAPSGGEDDFVLLREVGPARRDFEA